MDDIYISVFVICGLKKGFLSLQNFCRGLARLAKALTSKVRWVSAHFFWGGQLGG